MLTFGAIYVKQGREIGLQIVGDSRYFWLYHQFQCLHWKGSTDHGLTFKVVMDLEPFWFQGYEVYTDNYYSSPSLFKELLDVGIRTTGTLRTNCTGVPRSVVALEQALENKIDHETGYYIHDPSSDIVYVCWRDVCVVTILSTAYPGHSEAIATRTTRVSGQAQEVTVPTVVSAQSLEMISGICLFCKLLKSMAVNGVSQLHVEGHQGVLIVYTMGAL